MKRQLLSFVAALLYLSVLSQSVNEGNYLSLESATMVSSGNEVPFWIQMNQSGAIDGSDAFQQLFWLKWTRMPDEISSDKVKLSYGANVLGRLSENSAFQLNEYWGRLHYKNWYLHAGAKAEPVFANGLSLTNGNLFLSNNARPMPRIEFGTENFQPFKNGWLEKIAFDFQYAEFILLDDRYVNHAHLHHKKLNIIYSLAPRWSVSAGIDHWVFWGGTVPEIEGLYDFKMPGFEEYFRYILGRSGSSRTPPTDQGNVAGNQLGQYMVNVNHSGENFKLKFYWQHLWEDRSGMELQNIADGLWGIYWQKEPGHLLESMVVEYTNTRDQSGSYHMEPDPKRPGKLTGRGRDNYFNNSVYRSGFVSYGRMLGIPLFIPAINADGVSMGFPNTRLWAIHHGMGGWFAENLGWKSWLSYSKHYGQHGSEYPSPKTFFSMAAQMNYSLPQKPLVCSLKLAYDSGPLLDSAFGAELRLAFKISGKN